MFKRALTFIVATVLLCTMGAFVFAAGATSLEISVDKESLRPGDKVTATVQLNNYADNWSAMSVDLTYDASVFELDGALEHGSAIDFKGFGGENAIAEIFRVDANTIRIVWMAMENIAFDEANPLVVLRLIAKEGAQAAALLTVQFAEDGQISIDGDAPKPLVSGTDFDGEKVSQNIVVNGIPWNQHPIIRMEVNKTNPQVGRELIATIYIEKYMPWSTLSVDFAGMGEYLRIKEVRPLGFTGEAIQTATTATVTNGSDVPASGEYYTEGTLKAMEVVFEPLKVSEGNFDLVASFKSGSCHSEAVNGMQGDLHFSAEGSAKNIKVAPAKTLLEVQYADPEAAANLKAGDTFDVYVNLKDHENEWTAFTLVGNYDPDRFELINIDTENYDYGYTVIEPDKLTDDLTVVWVATENIKINDTNPRLMKLTFKAIQAGPAEIGFSFKEDGVIAEDENGNLVEQDKGDNFTEDEEKVDVNVAPKPMQIVTRVDENLTAVEAGHTFDVIVSVKDCYEALAALSIKGEYNKDLFDWVSVTPILANFGENGQVITPEKGDDLEIVWLNSENVKLPSEFDAVRITLKAKQAANAADIKFSFLDDGVLRIGSNGIPAALEKDTYYKSEPTVVEMTVLAPSVDLRVEADKEAVNAGDEFFVDVYVTDYFAPMAGFAVKGNLDTEYFEVLEVYPQSVGGIEPMMNDDEANSDLNKKELEFVWLDCENIDAGAEEFKVLRLKVRAKKSSSTAQAITFDYIDGGMVRIDGGSGAPVELDRGKDFAQEAAVIELPIARVPVTLNLSFDKEQVQQGEEFTVAVNMADYESDWMSLAFRVNYDTALFEVVEESIEGKLEEEVIYSLDNESSPLSFAWLNYEMNPIEAEREVELVTFKLRAKADAKLGDASVGVQFIDGGMMDESGTLIRNPEGSIWSTEPIAKVIEIIEASDLIQVNLTWGDLSYTYNYGTWDPETHTWVGGNWSVVEDGDLITLENVGTVDVEAEFTYQSNAQCEGLTGTFATGRGGEALVAPLAVNAGEEMKKVYFSLRGKTEEEWEGTLPVGAITVTIDTADGGAA